MQETLEKLLQEVSYHRGEVMNDPQTWSETNVHGGGSINTNGQYGGGVAISSTVTTWTSLILKKENGKEYMAKLPYAFPARKGHTVIAADFRGVTIAAANDVTDELNGTINVVRGKLKDEDKSFKKSGLHKLMQAFSIAAPLALLLLFFSIDATDIGAFIIVFFFWLLMHWLFVQAPIKRKKEKIIDFIDKNLPKAAQNKMREMLVS